MTSLTHDQTSRPTGWKRKALLFGAVSVLLGFVYWRFGLDALRERVQGVNGVAFFALLSVLPVLGFPVSVLQVLAGVKFGFIAGLSASTAAILLNLLGTHWLGSRLLRQRLEALAVRTRWRIPKVPASEHSGTALLFTLLPGSYSLKNYLMVLGGISLRTLLLVCLPVYAVRAGSGIYFGGVSHDLTAGKLVLLGVNSVAVLLLSAVLLKRLRRRFAMVASVSQREDGQAN